MGYKIQWTLNKHFPSLRHVKDAKGRVVITVAARDKAAAKKPAPQGMRAGAGLSPTASSRRRVDRALPRLPRQGGYRNAV